jgi:hypothetical protein
MQFVQYIQRKINYTFYEAAVKLTTGPGNCSANSAVAGSEWPGGIRKEVGFSPLETRNLVPTGMKQIS